MVAKPGYLDGYEDYRPPEEEMPWSDVPLYGLVRMADDSGWYLMDRADGGRIELRRIFGGNWYRGEAPDKPARLVHQLGAPYTRPWPLLGVPHGTESLHGHLLRFHGIYEVTTTHWKTLEKMHKLDHLSLAGGNGWTPHTHSVPKD